MMGNRRNTTDDSNEGALDAMQAMIKMMETMRRQYDERLEEVRREQKHLRRESVHTSQMLEDSLRVQDEFRRQNEELK